MPKVQSNGGDFKQPQIGLQGGRIVKMIDLGTQMTEYKGQQKQKPQVQFQFELADDKMEDGRPLVIGKRLNLSLGDKADFTKLVIACTGIKPEEGYNPAELVGKACNLTIVEYDRGEGKKGTAIGGFSPLMRNQVIPASENPPVIFELDNFKQEIFDNLNDYYKEVISKSPEYAEIKGTKPASQGIDDDIPFALLLPLALTALTMIGVA